MSNCSSGSGSTMISHGRRLCRVSIVHRPSTMSRRNETAFPSMRRRSNSVNRRSAIRLNRCGLNSNSHSHHGGHSRLARATSYRLRNHAPVDARTSNPSAAQVIPKRHPSAFSADPALNHPICCAVMLRLAWIFTSRPLALWIVTSTGLPGARVERPVMLTRSFSSNLS